MDILKGVTPHRIVPFPTQEVGPNCARDLALALVRIFSFDYTVDVYLFSDCLVLSSLCSSVTCPHLQENLHKAFLALLTTFTNHVPHKTMGEMNNSRSPNGLWKPTQEHFRTK